MPKRHHVRARKSFEAVREGQLVALSENGLAAFLDPKKSRFRAHIELVADELEDGRIQLAGAKAPLELEHSRALIRRDGTLVENYEEMARPEVYAKTKAAKAKAA